MPARGRGRRGPCGGCGWPMSAGAALIRHDGLTAAVEDLRAELGDRHRVEQQHERAERERDGEGALAPALLLLASRHRAGRSAIAQPATRGSGRNRPKAVLGEKRREKQRRDRGSRRRRDAAPRASPARPRGGGRPATASASMPSAADAAIARIGEAAEAEERRRNSPSGASSTRVDEDLPARRIRARDVRHHRDAGAGVVAGFHERQGPEMRRRPDEDDGEEDEAVEPDAAGDGGLGDDRAAARRRRRR